MPYVTIVTQDPLWFSNWVLALQGTTTIGTKLFLESGEDYVSVVNSMFLMKGAGQYLATYRISILETIELTICNTTFRSITWGTDVYNEMNL